MKLKRTGFGDLQRNADARSNDVDRTASSIHRAVSAYRAHPTVRNHRDIALMVQALIRSMGGRRRGNTWFPP